MPMMNDELRAARRVAYWRAVFDWKVVIKFISYFFTAISFIEAIRLKQANRPLNEHSRFIWFFALSLLFDLVSMGAEVFDAGCLPTANTLAGARNIVYPDRINTCHSADILAMWLSMLGVIVGIIMFTVGSLMDEDSIKREILTGSASIVSTLFTEFNTNILDKEREGLDAIHRQSTIAALSNYNNNCWAEPNCVDNYCCPGDGFVI